MLPRPDQAPTCFQMTTSRAGGFGGACEPQAANATVAATTVAATPIQRFTPSCYRSVRALVECLVHPLVETLQHPMAIEHLRNVMLTLTSSGQPRLLDWLGPKVAGRRVRLAHASKRVERLERMSGHVGVSARDSGSTQQRIHSRLGVEKPTPYDTGCDERQCVRQ